MAVHQRAMRRLLQSSLLASALLGVATSPIHAGQAGPAANERPARAAPATPAATGRPNVILILADDLGVETINAFGGQYYTPHIDALARQGVMFDNAHAMPLCSPSRTRLMTGRENAKNYQAFGYLDPKERTFGNIFADAGYATGIVGKWQLGGNGFDDRVGATPKSAGFQESYLWQERAGIEKGSRYWGATLSTNGRPSISESGFGPDMMNEWALSFIDRHKAEPFFLYYPMVLTHSPFVPTPDSMTANGDQKRFSGMVSYLDTLIGNLLDHLKDLGLDKNTVVLFTGDNGTDRNITSWRNGAEVPGGKFYPTLNGTHVPMIIRWPGHLPENQRRDGLFDFEDVLPTLADAAGLSAPAGIDGVSQMPVAEGKANQARSWIFQHYAAVWVAPPSRYVFDLTRKLYGDGRYVALDPDHGVETPIDAKGGEEAKHRARLQQVLDTRNDGPLDPIRFPWCKGKKSVDPKLPAIEAGCGEKPLDS